MNPSPTPTDARVDHILAALRTAEPPAGLEQRIAARLSQAAESRALAANPSAIPASFFASIRNAIRPPRSVRIPAPLYAVAALTLVALTTVALLHHPAATTQSQSIPRRSLAPAPAPTATVATTKPSSPTLHTSTISTTRTTQLTPSAQNPPSEDDPDALALAETLAPSRPGPLLPPTPQEHLILAATRPGQPLQVAELDLARAPFLRAAARAHRDALIDRYVRASLSAFAVADALAPTHSPSQETTPPPPVPDPSNPPSN